MSRDPLPVLAAVDIGGTKVKIALADHESGVLVSDELPSGPETHAADLLTDVREGLHRLERQVRERRGAVVTVVAAGLVSPGVVSDGGIALAPNNPGMSDLTVSSIGAALGVVDLVWANDVKAAALAEHSWGGLIGARSGLYVNLGTGLSAGAVIDGRPLNGAHGAALEIAYLLPGGPSDRGHRSGAAPLEDLISGRALRARAARSGSPDVVASTIIDGYGDPGSPLHGLATEFVREFGRAVANLAITLDTDRICFGGGIAAATDSFLAPLRSLLDEYVPFPPELSVSARPDESSLFGAIRIACDAAGWRPEDVANPYGRDVLVATRPERPTAP
ncbi:ROK family protein [Curtobacterium sp. ISL-83]|uniref:ROK family protein n=1 Tax=Curtobacterium sp. ISL-83 TaxID=2819145 RepID=UPI001BE53367|nr:ROK family protein [Curtobacterium sp. ISL-83]MBT2503749.1 ROK family protein [Curtobacterium sp. ISL-83]